MKILATNPNLPTNIERATPDYIRNNIEKWDNNLLKLRARRLRVSEEEAAVVENKPLFLIQAEERARAEGCRVENILDQYADEFICSRYPTADCFLPDEVVEYAQQGTMPEERLGHADICSACAMLLTASLCKEIDQIPANVEASRNTLAKESLDRRKRATTTFKGSLTDRPAIVLVLFLIFGCCIFFIFGRRALQTALSVPLVWYAGVFVSRSRLVDHRPRLDRQESRSRWPFHGITDKGAAAILPILLLILGYGVFLLLDRRSALKSMLGEPLAWYLAIMGTSLYITASRGLAAYRTARLWTTGAVVGLVLIGFVYVNIQQIRSATAAETLLAFKLTQERTESLALAAIQQRRTTGQFPNAKQASAIVGNDSGNLVLEAKHSKHAATYTLTDANLRGEIVAEIGPDEGSITWEDGGKVLSVVRIVTATVKSVNTSPSNDTPPTVTFTNGSTYKLISLDGVPLLRPGTHVFAAVDPRDTSLQSFVVIAPSVSTAPDTF